MYEDMLIESGLSKNEAEVYVLLLKLKESSAAQIAKNSRISRPHVYDTVAKLVQKGLVSYIEKSGTQYYKPANPLSLLEYLKTKEDSITTILPGLAKLYDSSTQKPHIEVYEGVGGLRTVIKDIVRVNKPFIGIGGSTKWDEYIPADMKLYFKQRTERKLVGRILVAEGTDTYAYPYNHYKLLPKTFLSPSTTYSYGDRVVTVIWFATPIVITIKSIDYAQSFQSYFDLLWNQKEHIYRGIDGLKRVLDQVLEDKPHEFVSFGSTRASVGLFPEYIASWHKKRGTLKIPARLLYNDTPLARKRANLLAQAPLTQIRFLPATYNSPLAIILYGEKVILINLSKEGFAIIIDDPVLHQSYKTQFETFWKMSTA